MTYIVSVQLVKQSWLPFYFTSAPDPDDVMFAMCVAAAVSVCLCFLSSSSFVQSQTDSSEAPNSQANTTQYLVATGFVCAV